MKNEITSAMLEKADKLIQEDPSSAQDGEQFLDDEVYAPIKKQISSISDINLDIHAHHSSYDSNVIMPRLSKISVKPDLSVKLQPFKILLKAPNPIEEKPFKNMKKSRKSAKKNMEAIQEKKSEYHEWAMKTA